MENMITLFLIGTSVGLLFLAFRQRNAFVSIRDRYKNVIDIDEKYSEISGQVTTLRENYGAMKRTYDALARELSHLEENLEDISYGLYEPHYEYDTSEKYKAHLDAIRSEQKRQIHGKFAATCSKEWLVEGSKAEGKKMVNRMIKLMLRAFNGESDSAVSKVRWNNVQLMCTRVEKAVEAINKMGEPMMISISRHYVDLKLAEIRLTHEFEEKRQQEKEEQRLIKEQMREEARAQKELEDARVRAEKEEQDYRKALDTARREIHTMVGDDLDRMKNKIAALERRLESAHDIKERAISMAQQTKSGHVYVISNIGSFGETVFKIGMTRRLEPLDRVMELGDASVPFRFDVHAIIYSKDAPKLESQLHKHFESRRLNLVNYRREFFRARIDEIEMIVKALGADIEFTKIAEAREYRESLAIRKESKEPKIPEDGFQEKVPKFPETI